MMQIKIIITGTYGAGKTRFINTASEIDTIWTQVHLKNPSNEKSSSTVTMDYGRLTLGKDLLLNLFGTPSQDHFDIIWDVLSKGMKAFVFVVDSSDPASFELARKILSRFDSSLPYVVAANKQDYPKTMTVKEVRLALKLSDKIPIVPCASIEKESVLNVLEALTSLIDLDSIKPTL